MKVYVIRNKGSYGFVAPDVNASKGAFFHKRQVKGVDFETVKAGDGLDLLGEIVPGDRGPEVVGELHPAGTEAAKAAKEDEAAREREKLEELSRKLVNFRTEFKATKGYVPGQDLNKLFLNGGWDAVDKHLASEALRHELAQPPEKPLVRKKRVRQL